MKIPFAPTFIAALQITLFNLPASAQTTVLTGQVSRNMSQVLNPRTSVVTQVATPRTAVGLGWGLLKSGLN